MIKLNINEINTRSTEGKLIIAALGLLSSDKSPDEVLNNVCEMANQIFYEDEIKLRDDIKSLIIERLNKLYYSAEQSKNGDGGVPDIVSSKINEKVEDILNSLKEFGLFKVD